MEKEDIEDKCITLRFTNDNFGSNAKQILKGLCQAISCGFSVRYGRVVHKGKVIDSMEKYEEYVEKINGKSMPRQRFIFTSIIDWFVNNLKKDPEKIENFNPLAVGSLFDFLRNTKFKNKTLSKFFFDFYNKKAQKERWSLPCDRKKLIVIHLRIQCKSSEQILVEKNAKEIQRGGGQNYCGTEHLKKVIYKLKKKYKNHKIYLMTDPRASKCKNMIELNKMLSDEGWNDIRNNILGSEDLDKDLWTMMCADVLICDGSNFSLYGAVLNQGSERYMMKWFRGITSYLSQGSDDFFKKNKNKKYSYALQKKVLDKTLEGEEYIKRFKLQGD